MGDFLKTGGHCVNKGCETMNSLICLLRVPLYTIPIMFYYLFLLFLLPWDCKHWLNFSCCLRYRKVSKIANYDDETLQWLYTKTLCRMSTICVLSIMAKNIKSALFEAGCSIPGGSIMCLWAWVTGISSLNQCSVFGGRWSCFVILRSYMEDTDLYGRS